MSIASVVEPFLSQAARTPQTTAVRGPSGALSYGELAELSGRASAGLLRRGITPGEPVGVAATRTPGAVAALLAVARAGGVCVPLDGGQPAARLDRIAADAGVRLVVADGPAERAPAGVPVADLDGLAAEAVQAGAAAPRPGTERGGHAYILYTSGSTGAPKGVVMGHAAFASLIDWHLAAEGDLAGRATLQFAAMGFDVFFQEVFATLCAGGTLVLPRERDRRDPRALVELLAREGIDRLFLPSAVLHPVAVAAVGGPPLPRLRRVVCAGDRLRVTGAVRDWFSLLDAAELHNHYGPTETHVVTAHALTGDPAAWPDLPPIGAPLPHVRALVDDLVDDGRGGAQGEGELLIGGACLAEGYLGRPELTAERFVPSPGEGGRAYRTGDLVRRGDGGVLHYLGRTDRQVKIDGYRVEPGEVEAVLLACPGVRECAVVPRSDPAGASRLAAYVVPAPGEEAAPGAWRGFLAERLPASMVPAEFAPIGALPLTPNGKLDRDALPAPPAPGGGASAGAPVSGTRAVVAQAWCEVLGLAGAGPDDDFFALGGTSLQLMHARERLEERLGRRVEMDWLLDDPTVAGVARRLDAGGPQAGGRDGASRGRHRAERARRGTARRRRTGG
ncbi:non-ribosomal peptide synthetase [Nocardiopsis baichengensis]|uniref:non-ribosomal peptide synthetase n=1 Tax=Nocardiopsis baichengensis TaxID=280240 RepID=UPI00034B3982|nr:non-ribosomal peptide synthetase [Nocardiopsis baichengensis]